jgi:hypothetical protein
VIETRYAGCRFRSRLEARWAVLFDVIGLEWQYEPQGFDTPYGAYLPDFYIPDWDTWMEVKGELPVDLRREAFFADSVALRFHILAGDIPRPDLYLSYGAMARLDIIYRTEVGEWIDSRTCGGWLGWDDGGPEFRAALTRARSARFEHGEQG